MSRITVKQAADRVGVSESLVYQLCQERRLPHLRFGKTGRRGKILILEEELDAFLKELRVEAGASHDPATPTLRHISQK